VTFYRYPGDRSADLALKTQSRADKAFDAAMTALDSMRIGEHRRQLERYVRYSALSVRLRRLADIRNRRAA